MHDLRSFFRGIFAIKLPYAEPKPGWAIGWSKGERGFWCDYWTPAWHQGRGPYISIGLGLIAIYRGY